MPDDQLERFAEYEREVRRYASSWFKGNDAAQRIISRVPSVKAAVIRLAAARQVIGTDTIYLSGKRWLPERMVIQDRVVSSMFEDDSSSNPPDAVPMAVMIVGLPGSGKSSLMRPIAHELIARIYPSCGLTVDADALRLRIPEYADGLGSQVAQVEASYLTYHQFVDQAHRRLGHLVFDIVGDPEYIVDDVRYLIDAGWAVACLGAVVDVDVAVERVIRRALDSGRYVPPAYVRKIGSRPVDAYWSLRSSHLPLIGCALLDTSGEMHVPPTIIDTDAPELFGTEGLPTTLWSCMDGPG